VIEDLRPLSRFPCPTARWIGSVRDVLGGGATYVVTLLLLDCRLAPEIFGIVRSVVPVARG
jgi:hypothetical protein